MKYILYNLKSLKVEHIYDKPLTAKVCDNFYEINGIAEYNGETPKGDYLKVDNVREEIEKWTEKELVFNEELQQDIEVEVEKSRTHIVCDLVAHFYPKRELTAEQIAKQKENKYKKLCEKYISEKYSLADENKIVREYLVDMYNTEKRVQFDEYNAYVEQCKSKAKGEVYD